jgi:hypothetical protein
MENVREFLGVLESARLPPNRLKPSVMGGIGATFRRGDKKVYVEFYNDGRVHSLFSDGVSDPDTKSVPPDHAGYSLLVQDIQGFLND